MGNLSLMRRTSKGVRRLYHRLAYRYGVAVGRHDPLVPPGDLHSVGNGDFAALGNEFLGYFVDLAGLRPQDRVLDVGCGTGRMARPLTRYLQGGRYDGIDIVANSIEWCRKTYAQRFPNFQFHFLDAFNGEYNPRGRVRACDYRFPFADAAFDFTFLTSVFTHMLPTDMENYLREIVRMLAPGGRCMITYFLVNPDSRRRMGEGLANPAFDHELPGCRIQNTRHPEAAVAYDESRVRELYEANGLEIMEPIRFGSWSGRKDGLSYQDIVVARKRA